MRFGRFSFGGGDTTIGGCYGLRRPGSGSFAGAFASTTTATRTAWLVGKTSSSLFSGLGMAGSSTLVVIVIIVVVVVVVGAVNCGGGTSNGVGDKRK